MSFLDCMKKNLEKGLLSKTKYKNLEKEYNQLVETYTETMGEAAAAKEAAARFINYKTKQLEDRARVDIMGAQAQKRITDDIMAKHKSEGTRISTLYADTMLKAHNRKEAVLRQVYSSLNEFVDQYSSKLAGLKTNRHNIKNVVRSLVGENTDDALSNSYGRALRDVFDYSNQRYKASGGVLGELDNYFPQVHIRERLKDVSFEEWDEFITTRLDMNKMIDDETGLPFTKEKLREVNFENYQNIITNGRHSLQKQLDAGLSIDSIRRHGFEVSTRRQMRRFYHFKDADSFLEYNDLFGTGEEGLYDMITGSIDMMARDIGIIEVMGPKPTALNRNMVARVAASGESKVRQQLIRGQFDVLVGNTDGDVSNGGMSGAISNFIYNTQNVLRSAMLGSASISALSDSTFIVATARMNGLSGSKALGQYTKLLNPASSADRELANRTGYIAEIATQNSLQDMRMSGGDMLGNRLTSSMASFTNRASGLAAMTRAAKNSLALETQGAFADLANTKWADIDPKFREAMEVFDINAEDWEIIRAAQVTEVEGGAKFIRQNEIAVSGKDINKSMAAANKVDDFITHMQKVAVNEPTLFTRALTTGAAFSDDVRKGTVVRTLFSSTFMFKSFPITVLHNHIIPAIGSARKGRLEYLATIAVGTTLLGGAAIQMKELTKGKEPRDVTDPKFWSAAAMQGGGLGLLGDVLFAEYNRFGRDPITDMFIGPVGGLTNDVARTIMGNFDRALEEGQESNFATDTFKLVKRNLPGVNLWYSRLVLDRLFLDQIEDFIDPDFASKRARMERRQANDYGNGFWWQKGELTPE